ncbi:MAG: helix-turn-helix domain-containing protein [Parcubacteria group bacterium]|nr:helix-turn-helix domain-containing protein [Parcubacteria group bacterium]
MVDFRLSISEASKVFGISSQTIRRAIKIQEVKYIIVRGRYRLSFISLLSWSQKATSTRNKLSKKGVGQFVTGWKISNKLFSPHPDKIKKEITPPSSVQE